MFVPSGALLHPPEHGCALLYSEGSMLNNGNEWGNVG